MTGKSNCGNCVNIKKEASRDTSFSFGGVGEIRTLASLTTPNDLANRPLQPLEYHSIRC